ncbi:PXMP2/4 family protein 3 [Selaginella moellendorffii]|uniref:PXMP2/4 family protein 3 n=1 Tax=Selaginella moellendorffii TaxID=88036 RepID=UPI000D1CD712|nr:PXMP2/4 family protein 3 [Selaginella moellendorffii]|eukprot:XP_024517761.1 PXMP2/4 family protein 3 [Selaginella moellendorffii]
MNLARAIGNRARRNAIGASALGRIRHFDAPRTSRPCFQVGGGIDAAHGAPRFFSAGRLLQGGNGAGKSDVSKQKKGGFVGWYLNNLDKRPVVTKSLTACTIYTTADLVAQKLTAMKLGNDSPWDHVRTLRMSAVGLLMSGPTLHLWFNFLNKILPGRDMISTLKKMLLGQTTYGPAFTATFFSINALAQGENGAQIWHRLKRDLIPTLASGLMYWPFCDLITFRYVPVHLQPLVSNSFSLIWTVYLTYMASLK